MDDQLPLFGRPQAPPPEVATPTPAPAPPPAPEAEAPNDLPPPEAEPGTELDRRFATFHAANPHVYALLLRFAREVRAAGRERCGIRMIWERMRWELYFGTAGDDWKLNNDYTSRYARLLLAESDLAGLFEVRGLRS